MNPEHVANLVLDAIERHSRVSAHQILSRSKRKPVPLYRHIAITLTRWISGCSGPRAGACFRRSRKVVFESQAAFRRMVLNKADDRWHNLATVVTKEVKERMK